MAVSSERDAVGKVQVDVVPTEPQVINPNGTPSQTYVLSSLQCLLTIIRRNKLQRQHALHRRGNGRRLRPGSLRRQSCPALQFHRSVLPSLPKAQCVNVIDPFPVLVNNYFGRQFNSLNDVAVNFRNKHIYFTDTVYGYLQEFRPRPGLPNQVYRFNPHTGAVTVVADEFVNCNGE